jgi:hypothetical protein
MTTPEGVRISLNGAYVNEAAHDPADNGYPWILSDATVDIPDNISVGGGYVDVTGTENPNHPAVEGTVCNIFQADSSPLITGAVVYSDHGGGSLIFSCTPDQIHV